MKTHVNVRPFLIIAAIPVLILTGCATHRVNLVRDGSVSVDARLPDSMSLRHIHVYEEDEDVVVNGLATTPRLGSFRKPTGHIDIQIFDPVGNPLHEKCANLLPDSTPICGRRIPQLLWAENVFRFSARAPMTTNTRTVIRITYHEGSHGVETPLIQRATINEVRE